MNRNLVYVPIMMMLFGACDKHDDVSPNPIEDDILYKKDGRSVKSNDPNQIEMDINNDGALDYLTFTVLTSNQSGDHFYFGIRPIGDNKAKSGLPNKNYYLDLGFLQTESKGGLLNSDLGKDQVWTSGSSTIVLRHTNNDGSVWHEGGCKDETDELFGIRLVEGDVSYYGWLRFKFDKMEESLTLVDYAFNQVAEKPIKAGQKSGS